MLAGEATFSEEALAAPGGLEKAKAAIMAGRDATLGKHVELSRREKRLTGAKKAFKAEHTALVTEKTAFQAQRERAQRNVQLISADLAELRSGDAERMVKALGRLTGAQDPYAHWRAINAAAAKGEPVQGSRPAAPATKDPELAELKSQLSQALERLTKTEERALLAEEAGHRARIIENASDEATYPHLAKVAKGDPDGLFEHVASYIHKLQAKGERVSLPVALARIEAQAAKILGGAPARDAASQATATRQGKTPPTKAPSARQEGRSWDESKQALVKDPALWKNLGLPGG